MSIRHAIMLSLAEQPAAGYDLTRRFDRSVGFFWRATHQQIYRTLGQMEAEDLVSSTREVGDGKPDRKVYTLTDAGRAELADWTTRPSPPEPLRSEFAVKVRAMPYGDRAAVVDDIRRRRDEATKLLDYYERNEARNYPQPELLDDAALPAYLVLRGGIHSTRAHIDWCDEMLGRLDAQPPAGTEEQLPEGTES